MPRFISAKSELFGRFLIAGGVSVIIYYALLYGLTELFGVWYVISALVAFVVYYCANFALQKFWAFKNAEKRYVNQQLLQYSAMSIGNWILNTYLLYALVEYFHFWYMWAQLILTVIASIIAFFGLEWIFRHHR